jgi:nicotinamide phosphoribosyltransferase
MKIFAPHATDFYKTGHPAQNPEGTEIIYANFTGRSDRLANMPEDFDHKIVVANIQGTMKWMLRDLWNDTFFHQPKAKVLEKYKRRMDSSLGEGVVGTDHFAELHDLGYLPLHIKALPEGSRVNIGVPFLTAQNTHKDFKWMAPWATNYIETAKSSEIWKAVNVATIAYEFRRLLDHYAEITGSNPQFVDFQGHDFSARGVGGIHDAAAHQIGHLYSFKGTDTILSIDYLDDYYDCGSEYIGGSIPATEHSVTCLGGQKNELETIRRIITKVYPTGPVSVVSDTWNYWDMLTVIAPALKEDILSRRPNAQGIAKVVFRPDSGDPEKIICGDPEAAPGSREFKGSLQLLWEVFGGTVNEKGFKVLNPRVGLIYGDSITLSRAKTILEHMRQQGWASENIVFGIGSYTYQYHTRDTFGIAYKTTWGQINGVPIETMKDPVTDRGTKKSAKGLLRVEKEGNDFVLYQQQTREQEQQGALQTVFLNSEIYGEDTNSLPNVRSRLVSPNT